MMMSRAPRKHNKTKFTEFSWTCVRRIYLQQSKNCVLCSLWSTPDVTCAISSRLALASTRLTINRTQRRSSPLFLCEVRGVGKTCDYYFEFPQNCHQVHTCNNFVELTQRNDYSRKLIFNSKIFWNWNSVINNGCVWAEFVCRQNERKLITLKNSELDET